MLPQVLLVVAVGSLLQAIEAADCNLSEERQSDFPSGQDISNALIKQDSLNNICSNEWSPLQNLIKTYNEGFVVYNVTRKTTDAAPEDNGCQTGFQNIVDQCIVSSNYWGGTYTFNDFTYAISNAVYPSNGLPSWDAAPSATESTSTDETLATSSVSTTVYPDSTQSSDDGSSSTITPAPGPIISLGDSSPTSTPGQTIVTETNSAGDQIVATVRSMSIICSILSLLTS